LESACEESIAGRGPQRWAAIWGQSGAVGTIVQLGRAARNCRYGAGMGSFGWSCC
jgi:hypothetical protein